MRHILVCVAGLTPQIITESLYGLMIEPESIPINEIRVLTTLPGKACILEKLLKHKQGKFYQFCRDYKINPDTILFNESTIAVLRDAHGNPLIDIRNDSDNHSCADQIINCIRLWTGAADTALHCSVAGGRKTMGVYLGYSLQLYGRPQDTLSHVLVNEEFEMHPEFYYIPRKPVELTATKGTKSPLNTRNARIELAKIPFLRLRKVVHEFFQPSGENSPSGADDVPLYQDMVQELQKEFDTIDFFPDIVFHLRQRTITIGQHQIHLEPSQALTYIYFLKNKIERCVKPDLPDCSGCDSCFMSISDHRNKSEQDRIIADGNLYYGRMSPSLERFQKRMEEEIDRILSQVRSKINRKIKSTLLSSNLSNYYSIVSHRLYGSTKYGIPVDKNKIRMIED